MYVLDSLPGNAHRPRIHPTTRTDNPSSLISNQTCRTSSGPCFDRSKVCTCVLTRVPRGQDVLVLTARQTRSRIDESNYARHRSKSIHMMVSFQMIFVAYHQLRDVPGHSETDATNTCERWRRLSGVCMAMKPGYRTKSST
jgi:hypothetical protein